MISLSINKIRARDNQLAEGRLIFVIDHNRPNLIKMSLDIIKLIGNTKVIVITSSNSVFKTLQSLKTDNIEILNIKKMTKSNLSNIKSSIKFVKLISTNLSRMIFYEKLSMFFSALQIVGYEDLYNHLITNKATGVVTLCDAHLHEQVITRIANNKNVPTNSETDVKIPKNFFI